MGRLLEFLEGSYIEPARLDRAAVIAQWSAANDRYIELEKSEAGLANRGTHRALDPVFEPLAAEVAAHPHFRRSFDTLPTRFGMVELDSLIVYQHHVTRNFVQARMERLGAAPTDEALFRLCLPIDEPEAPVEIRKVGARRYVFRCPSTDFRFQESLLFRPDQIGGHAGLGTMAGIVGLLVGFGCNFLNVVQVGQRMMLNNGYHRAVALRALGVTHVPCVIQSADRADQLSVTIKTRVADNPEFYFESARPPLLRDFFDPLLWKLFPVRPLTRQIEVNFEVKDFLVAG
jgi:hypothetical protein